MNTTLHIGHKPVTLENITRKAQEVSLTFEDKHYTFRLHRLADGGFVLEREIAKDVWQRMAGASWKDAKDVLRVQLNGLEISISEAASAVAHSEQSAPLSPLAPMPGIVRRILVKRGDSVKQGQALAVMEAMKLQITLTVGGDAIVDDVLVGEGEMIAEGVQLVKLTALSGKA